MSDRYDELRNRILENDRVLVAGVNERLRLVAELWELKRLRGEHTFDAAREQALRSALAQSNDGPLSTAGLDLLVSTLLDLTKAELERSSTDEA